MRLNSGFAKSLMGALVCLLGPGTLLAASVTFVPHELFRIPFGSAPEALGARVDGDHLTIPADFTMDNTGRFYIYDPVKHRIARYSFEGRYEMQFRYLASAEQVFAHADAQENLWLLLSDAKQGIYYGVYERGGRLLHSGVFAGFDQFRIHRDDEGTLHVILSVKRDPNKLATYLMDEPSRLLKKEAIARPPEDHHRIQAGGKTFFVDAVPAPVGSPKVNRITDEAHRSLAAVKGSVLYITNRGELVTRVGECQINLYGLDGERKGGVEIPGLPSTCASLRFDAEGSLYELDGTPGTDGTYSAEMPGMRLIRWERR